MATIEIPDYLLEAAETTPDELNAELATLTPQEAVERLQRISKSVQDFLLFVVFELRTPVTAMIGYTELLLLSDHRLTPDKQKTFVAAIREDAQAVSRNIDAVFDIFQYEIGKLELQLNEVDLNDLISQVISEISENIDYRYDRVKDDKHKKAKPEFVYTIPNELPKISADKQRIYRILVEILSTAVRMYDSKSERRIAFIVSYDENWVTMKVSNDGVDLPSHLNEQTPGLYPTTKHIIEMHGGEMKVKKPESGGWIVNFILPIYQEQSSQ
ncbi:MAG: HAMP domain-containing histidine kinase [Deltaproteobacteria bacterium]|nr:HAMP domain-containing histidine kinase [Deltaproteobacteria bacterium]